MSWGYDHLVPEGGNNTQQPVSYGVAPVGNDAMVATATSQGLSNDIAIAQQQNAHGQSTYNEQDIALLTSRVEARVKQMIASGATDQEIQQSVGNMAPPELADIAHKAAQAQIDAEKFNIFSSRNGNGQSANNQSFQSAAWAGVGALTGLGAAGAIGPDGLPLSQDVLNQLMTTGHAHTSVVRGVDGHILAGDELKEFERKIASGELHRVSVEHGATTTIPLSVDGQQIPQDALNQLLATGHAHTSVVKGPDGHVLSGDELKEFERRKASGEIRPVSVEHGATTTVPLNTAQDNPYGLTADRMPVADMGSTTAALAAAVNGFTPTPGVGTVQRSAGVGRNSA